MKLNLFIIALLFLALSSCDGQNPVKQSKASMEKDMQTSITKKMRTQEIRLKKGELFLAVVGYQMAGKEDLLKEYFGIVFPPAQKQGFTPLGQLPIDEVSSGDFNPNEFVGLFKWPGMPSVQAFLKDVSPERLNKLRVKIWSELKQHMVVVPKDLQMTFKENKVYEVKMLWADKMLDIQSINKQGGAIVLNQPIAGYEDLGKHKAPNHLLIIEWDNKESAKQFNQMNPLKLKKEESFYTHFAFPQKK
ncbi:hypothetical protein BKI52_08600 [marine bacterium AO1-C]|nr:hypothetical protein BKI52_08600 [marine bacterium AO1-C]